MQQNAHGKAVTCVSAIQKLLTKKTGQELVSRKFMARQLSVSQTVAKKEMLKDMILRLLGTICNFNIIAGYRQFSCLGLISILVPTVPSFFVSLSQTLGCTCNCSYDSWMLHRDTWIHVHVHVAISYCISSYTMYINLQLSIRLSVCYGRSAETI